MKQNRVAVTGGVGSGKTEVMKILAASGCVTLSADEVAKEVNRLPFTAKKVAKAFGGKFVKDGVIDTKALGEFVFANNMQTERLNKITHPLIKRRLKKQLKQAGGGAVFVEVPLLIETGAQKHFHKVWVVTAPHEMKVARLKQRGMSAEQIKMRMERQLTDSERIKFADYIITNDGTASKLQAQVAAGLEKLKEKK